MFDPHNYKRKLELTVKNLKENTAISDKNRGLILKFKDDCLLEISVGRTVRYVQNLKKIAVWLDRDFEKCTKDDIKSLVARINNENYTEWTKHFYKVTIRKFWKWVRGIEEDGAYPEEVKWIKCTVKLKKKRPEDIPRDEDILKLLNACSTPRDRALVAVLYGSGCRIGELMALKIKDIKFDGLGAYFFVDGKTGERRVRLIAGIHYLTEWINNHPRKDEPDAPLWIRYDGKDIMGYNTIRKVLMTIAKRVNFTKKVNPHNFRHGASTFLGKSPHVSESVRCKQMGWVPNSRMPGVYTHLIGDEVDGALANAYGVENPKKKHESLLKSKRCYRCFEANPPTYKLCKKCGMPLEKDDAGLMLLENEERKKMDGIMDKLLDNEEFREMLRRKMRELQ